MPPHSDPRLHLRVPVVLLAVFVIAWATACGDGGSATTVIEHQVVGGQDADASTAGPRGALAAERIGPVSQGTTTDEVRGLFGRPDAVDHFPGCEVDRSSTPMLVWKWALNGGELQMSFDGVSGRLASYRIDSSSLGTTLGDRVGDRFAALKESWGNSLKPLSIGVASTAQAGYWYIGDPETAELLFDIRDGRIASISGGYLPVCE